MMKTIQNLIYQKVFSKTKPTVKFHNNNVLLKSIPHPVHARKAMPEWYKKLKPKIEGTNSCEPSTVKRCMPFMDSVSNGFIIPLWSDLFIKVEKGYNAIDKDGNQIDNLLFPYNEELIGTPSSEGGKIIFSLKESHELMLQLRMSAPVIYGQNSDALSDHAWKQVGETCDLKKFKLGKVLLKFNNPWIIETPKGYSVQFKNPSNNWSTNIEIIEGIVDTDEFYTQVNFPFVWTGNEVGEFIIPAGTPLVQVIPFKREEYNLETGLINEERNEIVKSTMATHFHDRYKSTFWHKSKNKTI
jgi:hypothetical protein